MGPGRRFTTAFKRQVAEELLAGAASAAQLCRRYELCPTVLANWKQQYAQGRLAEADGRRAHALANGAPRAPVPAIRSLAG